MTLKTRRVFFYSLILVFLFAGAGLIFYSNGWRIDWETLKISQSGGLFIKTASSYYTVKINKKNYASNAGLLYSGALTTHLFPKTYKVEVTRENYQSWKKELSVKPSLVTETYPIILMPRSPKEELVASSTKKFWVGPKYIARQNNKNKLLINNKPVAGNEILTWSANGDSVLTIDNLTKNFFLVNAAKSNTALNLSLAAQNLLSAKIKEAQFNPQDNNKILLLTTAGGFYSLDIITLKIEKLFVGIVEKVFVQEKGFLWIGRETGSKTRKVYASSNYLPNHELALAAISPQLLSASNLLLKLSPDLKKAALINNNLEVAIYFLENDEILNKKAGDSIYINYGVNFKPSELQWHKNSAYLWLLENQNLYLAEIDNRSFINIQPVKKGIAGYGYKVAGDEIYTLTGNNLYKLDLQ